MICLHWEKQTDDETEQRTDDDLVRRMTDKFIQNRRLMFDTFEIIVQQAGLEADSLTDTGRIVHDDRGENEGKGEHTRVNPFCSTDCGRERDDGRAMGARHSTRGEHDF